MGILGNKNKKRNKQINENKSKNNNKQASKQNQIKCTTLYRKENRGEKYY